VPISEELSKLFLLTDRIVRLSNGRFDPTIEKVQSLWKEHLQQGTEPSDQAIESLAVSVGWDKVHFANGVFAKDHDDVMIDLGGIAKGYAVDLLVDNLIAQEFSDVYVEWGGEIKAHGRHPYKRPWRVYISRFEDTNMHNAIAIVDLEDIALATSGDYLQKWKVGDIEYFHVLDPHSARPLKIGPETLGSVSIACNSCALADGIATAAISFPTESEAEHWLNSLKEEYPELRFWLLSRGKQ
jgi:thiamine biosynthesis lipoprotein